MQNEHLPVCLATNIVQKCAFAIWTTLHLCPGHIIKWTTGSKTPLIQELVNASVGTHNHTTMNAWHI